MEKKTIGFEITMREDEKVTIIEPPEKTKAYLRSLFPKKNHTDYLTEFLASKKNYEIAINAIHDAMERSLPKEIKKKCQYCNGESEDKCDKKCTKYVLQMQMTFMVAANEFIHIVFKNRFIYNNKSNLQKLTIEFFNCFRFIEGKGLMYFDLDQMCRSALNFGFLSLSELFAKSETLNAYTIINQTLDSINDEDLQNKVLQRKDENYIELQKEFFENKLRYYKEKIFVEEKDRSLKVKGNITKKVNDPSILQYALYYYYLQMGGDFGYFENHPKGKVKAIQELITNEGLNTTIKYFQKVYNKIAHYTTNRIAKNQLANIDFVANTMLKDFPKAKKIALLELKEAKTKNR
ncbi:hypothetical protein [Flavivirga sp. 57AJ16]|uniref:hypothetical protein n=1 Tax=Flavivirga sp. 57AJ16 TaxID=3025307 RepID=UPI002366E6A4|nr:hypothetical protein [Flavivirga sp. 57AJ16]MDD7886124.1 hypothetical protein [Flavivirga sp. 57AJ16]